MKTIATDNRSKQETDRVVAAAAAGGPWWTGPTWVRVTPGRKWKPGDLSIYSNGEKGK